MINTEEFTIRIQAILDTYELTAAAFAEKMGIGRSSISHIISGRNKPSLEFVLHILENFPEITFEWLVYGKGIFPKENTAPTLNPENRVFEKKQDSIPNIEKKQNTPDLFSTEGAIKKTTVRYQTNESIESINQNNDSESIIERIVIFYTDGTFKEYKTK